ncbi:hypothetical protein ECHHL_0220 [Ehrlichia chaffeensis str. Heartland]|uniref:YhdP central domain-containing protein n=1 Tax=Ehrlichia chaffeensis (strain ATCC CRL-10679 / Arkansas) TaxID=205920 RepID=Q2GHJ8_EHRCR|nr:AsmA-like C-terminal domain-containing protein [Ehrlichia chaffeensis]ABD45203.1 conserved hypothetical protein [Ehrlichia chaffeensis str. Arkansas]AHX03386.1 hypothetical protein ECHHL_0220 [Ehrlichia chaffeensis str. Heartland]AHX05893.1 hypothetical protein ECHJAX_0837 [Ehrlichia chaffeensis str. Jax]AHX06885.1 hypothetical protein ECHLIB_0841 [Ehrlichia chaffeensis str. Liberty]AHX07268.1 hypothetical protein ECHOSC_0228 [Ehrlichia chaffeensis str. Osceola]
MLKKKKFIRLFFILMISIVCSVSYLYVRDRDVIEINAKFLNFYVKHKLATVFPGSEIDIGSTTLTWQNKSENFILSSQNLTIKSPKLGANITIPKFLLYSRVGILFLWGNCDFSYIDIPKIRIEFYDIQKKVGINLVENSVKILKDMLLKAIKLDIPVFISNAILAKHGKEDLMIKQLSVKMNKGYDKNTIDFNVENDNSFISMTVHEHYKGIMSFEISYGNFNTKVLGYLGNLNAKLPLYDNLNFSGDIVLRIDEHDEITYGDVNIQRIKGVVPCVSSRKCYIHDFRTRLVYQNDILSVKNFFLLLDQSKIVATGMIDNENVDLTFNFDVIFPKTLCDYWFVNLYPDLNRWYCTNVTDGKITDLKLQIKGKRDGMFIYNDLSNYNVSANIENVSIKFNHNFDPVRIVHGKLYLRDNQFIITSDNSDFKGVVIQDGILKIDNLKDENAVMTISGSSVGDVKQLYKAVNKDEFILLDNNKIFGKSHTNFDFKIFNLLNDDIVDYVSYIHAQIESFKAGSILNTFDVYDAKVDVTLHDNDVNINTQGYMNGFPMSLKVDRNLQDNYKFHYEFAGYISADNIKELGIFEYGDCSGVMKSNLQWDINANNTVITGDVDLSQLKIHFDGLTHNNFDSVVKFSASFQDKKEIKIDSASIVGKGVDIELSGKTGANLELLLNKVKLKDTDITAELKRSNDSITVKVFGESLDLSTVDFSEMMKGESPMQQTKIDVNVSRVMMKNNVVANNVDFKLSCYDTVCNEIKLTGNFLDNSNFSLEYGPIGLEINTDNAGELLRAIDILKVVDKGKLSFYMYPVKAGEITSGMFSLTNFHLVNASILAQILTLSSLKGVVNTLNGKGIYFNALNAPFTYQDNLISIDESWIEGSELGISLGGEIDLNTKMFNIKGQIIPAYVINKIIWQTPIIGKLLTGGQSRGVIAIDYKVKGTDKDHDLSVNLMSILTPNLLKRVLKIFDSKLLKKEHVKKRSSVNKVNNQVRMVS